MDTLNTSAPSKNKRLVILGCVLAVLLVILSFFLFSNRSGTNPLTNQSAQQGTNQSASQQTVPQTAYQVSELPEVSFATWSGLQKPSGLPTKLNSYMLKQQYSMDEVRALAQKLQVADSLKRENNVVTSYTIDQNEGSASILVFNTDSGEYSYRSSKGVLLPGSGNAESKVIAFLTDIGWYDPTLKVTATYRNKQKAGVLYVEVHRDWTALKSPIFNRVGLLNIPEDQDLNTMTLKTSIASQPEDPDIYAASDSRNGFARPDDFNTITIAVDEKTQAITLIKSNIRVLSQTASSVTLLSYEDAVERLKNKQYEFMLTSPAGSGTAIDWGKVYPGNIASANEAVVTDSLIAYLEETPSVVQDKLLPYYVFRGTAQLDSYLIDWRREKMKV